MLKKQTKALCTAAILALAIAGAAKAEDAKIKSASFSIKVPYKSDINVTSSDGSKWDTIVPQTFPLWADAVVDTRHPGYVERVGIWLGQCTGSGCGTHPRLFFDAPMVRDWKFHHTFSFDTGKIPVSKGGIPVVSIGDDILKACNTQLQPDGATKQHSPNVRMNLSLSVNTRKALSINYQILEASDAFNGGDVSRHTGFNVKVNCLAFQGIQAPPKPLVVDIRVKQKGKTCPKDTEVTAYIDYDKPMTARFRVIHNGKEPKSEPIEIKARKVSFAGKTWYRVERMERYRLDPGKHSFQITVMGGGKSPKKTITVDCPPFEPTSMWLTLNKSDQATCPKNVDAKVRINANGPGSVLTKIKNQAGVVMAIESIEVKRDGDQYIGRLTKSFNMSAIDTMLIAEDVNDTAHNTGWQPLKVECLEVLSGTLEQRGFAANRCKGEAALSIRTNGPGKVPYRLECTGGRAWNRNVQAHETGPNTFIGVDVLKFDVSNNELVRCALRTRQPLPFKLLDGAKRTYECHKSTGVSSADDLSPETRPEDPPPLGQKLTGDFSFLDRGGTKCPRGRAVLSFKNDAAANIHYSLDCTNGSFSGVVQPVAHPKGGFVALATVDLGVEKTSHVNCALKTVAPEQKLLTAKGHLFSCVKPTGPTGSTDLTPETGPGSGAPGAPGKVVDPPRGPRVVIDPPNAPDTHQVDEIIVTGSRISCAGGTVKKGACDCPRTHKPVKAGKNAWRCVKVVVDPVPGGTAVDSTSDKGKARHDAAAERRRLEALKKRQEAEKRAEEAKRKKAAKNAAEAKRKREAAKKAAELKRKLKAAKAAKAKRKRKVAAEP